MQERLADLSMLIVITFLGLWMRLSGSPAGFVNAAGNNSWRRKLGWKEKAYLIAVGEGINLSVSIKETMPIGVNAIWSYHRGNVLLTISKSLPDYKKLIMVGHVVAHIKQGDIDANKLAIRFEMSRKFMPEHNIAHQESIAELIAINLIETYFSQASNNSTPLRLNAIRLRAIFGFLWQIPPICHKPFLRKLRSKYLNTFSLNETANPLNSQSGTVHDSFQ